MFALVAIVWIAGLYVPALNFERLFEVGLLNRLLQVVRLAAVVDSVGVHDDFAQITALRLQVDIEDKI